MNTVTFEELANMIKIPKSKVIIIKGKSHHAFLTLRNSQICLKRLVRLFFAILLLKKKRGFKNVLI